MAIRLAVVIVTGCLLSGGLRAQTSSPALTGPQRQLLQALVAAVDGQDAASAAEPTNASWQTHVLRASDGSHYVAFSARPPAGLALPAGPVALYVRLSSVMTSTTRAQERSPLREWLAGKRSTPPPIARTGIAIGDMPTMGATGNFNVRPPTSSGMNDLRLMDLERRRERERQAEQERVRRAELEGKAAAPAEIVPFEDFDLAARPAGPDGVAAISRALTAGPGEYVLTIAWADPAAADPAATVRMLRTPLRLGLAPAGELAVSSVILADGISVRDVPYPPHEQAAHPYTIGLTEITPAADASFANDDTLNVVFQVINARASGDGKPDIEITSRIVRRGDKPEPVASLRPLSYAAANMPADFDLRLGHPLIAALAAPLESLGRGPYRLELLINDRLASRSITTAVDFTVTPTPLSLLKEAPAMGVAFERDQALGAAVRAYVVPALRPAAPSPALSRALDLAAAGKFLDLMAEEPVNAKEDGVRTAIRAWALLAAGDSSAAVQFQRGVLLGAPVAPSRVLSGAARALQQRDPDAIAAWQEALKAGAPAALVAPMLLEAYVRRGDFDAASALVAAQPDLPPTTQWLQAAAATAIATGRDAEAIRLLDTLLAKDPGSLHAQWLRLRALYSQFVAGQLPNTEPLITAARAYIDAKGPHAALAADWLGTITR